MKVHPLPGNRRITPRYGCRREKLRRLPHIFEKILELPFHSDADVSVVEASGFLRFTVTTDGDIGTGIRADIVEIHPGLTKIVVRGSGLVDSSLTELELDLWRIRLPDLVLPELAEARYDDGDLVVTVPKAAAVEEEIGEIPGGTVVLVQ